MTSRNQFTKFTNKLLISILIYILFCVFTLPIQVHAKADAIPTLNEFIATVTDGNAETLRGVYVADVMAYPIIQQPYGHPGFVSTTENVTTQFSMASEVGNIGLLAHNHLAGSSFVNIKSNDRIILVYGDGHVESFLVESIEQFQALSPLSPYSEFKDLETQDLLSAEDLFREVYRGEYHLTLQTCIDNEGNSSWGRLFIVAKPIPNKAFNVLEEKFFDPSTLYASR